MKIVDFGNSLSKFGTKDNDKYETIKYKVNRAIDCWIINKEQIHFVLRYYIDQDLFDDIIHSAINRYGIEWINQLSMSDGYGLDVFCNSISSYYKLKLQENLAKHES